MDGVYISGNGKTIDLFMKQTSLLSSDLFLKSWSFDVNYPHYLTQWFSDSCLAVKLLLSHKVLLAACGPPERELFARHQTQGVSMLVRLTIL